MNYRNLSIWILTLACLSFGVNYGINNITGFLGVFNFIGALCIGYLIGDILKYVAPLEK
jgi:uncharacterized membrane protein YjjB (DUF3815 family)